MKIKTPSDLKFAFEQTGINPHFFTRRTMRFFGDTMRNYGLRRCVIETSEGKREALELWRKRAVRHCLTASRYFDPTTLENLYPVDM